MGARRSRHPSDRPHRHRRLDGAGQSTRGRADELCAACPFWPQPVTARPARGARNQDDRRQRDGGVPLDWGCARLCPCVVSRPGAYGAPGARGARRDSYRFGWCSRGDIFGTEVDVAARVVGGIEGAEIWLSDQAKRDLERAGARRHRGLQWLPHEGVELKGIGTERLWSLMPAVAPGAAPPVPETSATNGAAPETSASNGAARVEGPATIPGCES